MRIEETESMSPVQDTQTKSGGAVSDLIGGMAGTAQIETEFGWKPAADLKVGDRIYTYDGGLRRLDSVTRSCASDHGDAAIELPGGVLSNSQNVVLCGDQHLLIETPIAEGMFGKPAIMVAASDLIGFGGTREVVLAATFEFIHLGFAQEEVIWANSGMLVQCSKNPVSEYFATATGFHARLFLNTLLQEAGEECLQTMVA